MAYLENYDKGAFKIMNITSEPPKSIFFNNNSALSL